MGLVMMITGCQHLNRNLRVDAQEKTVEPAHQDPPLQKTEETESDSSPEPERVESIDLDQAEAALLTGDCASALAALDQALASDKNQGTGFSDRALHILVDVLKHPNGPGLKKTPDLTCFLILEKNSPDSVYGPASACWLAVLNTIMDQHRENRTLKKTIRSHYNKIQTLTLQIEQLKAVDLESVTPDTGDQIP